MKNPRYVGIRSEKVEYSVTVRNYEQETGKLVGTGTHMLYRGPSYEEACRAWDRISYRTPLVGSISIQVWDAAGCMVRDGNLLTVDEQGRVYVNPSPKPRRRA